MELKDWLNSINQTKKNLIDNDPSVEKDYPPYIINRCFSGHLDAVLFANEMNRYNFLPKKMQYDFYINSLRTKKRFSPWLRKDMVKDLDYVKRYYGYSNEKAKQALKILTKKQLNFINWRSEMSVVKEPVVTWSPDQMIEVTLNEPDDFLKVRETLTRIGVASRKEKKIYQSCHILHKQGRYFLVHFKELFALDGKHANLTINDVQRRNRIAQLLADWGLVGVVDAIRIQDIAPLNQIKVLSYKDKGDWILETKYNIGAKKKKEGEEG